MDNSNKNKALVSGTLIYAIGNFGTKILTFLIVPLYTFYIKPGDLGDYDLLMTTVSLLSPLLTMKISDATYRWIINDRDNEVPSISATYQLLLQNCMLCAVLLLLVNYFIPIWHCYYFIAILICDRILECLQKLLRGIKKQKLFAMSGLFYTALLVSLNFIQICVLKKGVIALLQGVIISQIATIALILLVEKRLRVLKLSSDYRSLQKEMLKYSIPLVPSALCWWVMSASNRYVIRWILGKSANGIFAVACKFPSILQTVFLMFNNSWTDLALAELEKDKESEKYTSKIFEQLYKLSFGLATILIPATKVVTQLILSDSYKSASVYIGFLYLGTVFQGLSSFCSIGYLKGKKTIGAATTSLYGAVVNLTVDVILINFIGLFAASLSTFLGFFVMWLVRMRDIRDVFPVRINKFMFITRLIAVIVIAAVTIWTNVYIDLILTCVFGLFVLIENRKSINLIISKIRKKLKFKTI